MITFLRALYEGWYVSIADDSGPQAAFCKYNNKLRNDFFLTIYYIATGLQAAYATLDSLRAIKQSGNVTGISSDPIISVVGYSGGGFVAAWVRLS